MNTTVKNKSGVKRLKIGLTVLALSFMLALNMRAQDIHFSQFYTTPLLTNPANTGMSDDNLRIANTYRNQWAKIGVPYKTMYTSVDTKLIISNQAFGIGGAVIHDQSSAYSLLSDEFLLSFSYSKIINNQQITVGIQPGFVTKSYNQNGLTFGSQFDLVNQQFNSNLPSSENSLTGNLHYVDLNVGVFWRTMIRNIMPMAGISIRHVIRPVQSFSSTSAGSRLPMKLTFNSQAIIPLSGKFDLTPCIIYGYTSGVQELVAGGLEGYTISGSTFPVKKIYAVTMFRVNPLRNIDAMIFGGGIKFMKFDVAMTYDSNVSPLKTATNFNGAFELSLVLTGGNHSQKNGIEPCRIY